MQSLFSEHWHIVRHLKPQLRQNIEVLPRILRGKAWFLLYEPMSQRFVRVNPETWYVITLFDGQSNVEQIWDKAAEYIEQQNINLNQQYRAISQNELVQLLTQLYNNDLLQTEVSFDAEEMFKRFKKHKFNKFKQSFLNPISIKIPLIYPDAFFNRFKGLAQSIFSIWGLLIWIVIVFPALLLLAEHWQSLTSNLSDRVLSTSNLFILWLTYPIVKLIHEFAHGLAIKAWHGNVREMGLMFILFIPIPYVDATSSYHFISKWQRIAVSIAGILTELLLGAIAIYLWVSTESGLVHAFAYNVIFIATVSTVLVNGNPLMRYDGYYILSDLLEIPNLAGRATKYWVYLSDRYLLGAKTAQPPYAAENERFWLISYGFFSPIYRILIMVGLIWFVAQKYFFFGVLLAMISGFMVIILPLYKGVKHIYQGATLSKYRDQAIQRFWWIIAVCLFMLCILPFPYYSTQQAIVWLPETSMIRANESGHIQSIDFKNPHIEQNQTLFHLSNPDLMEKYELQKLQVEELEYKLRQASLDDLAQRKKLEYQQQGALQQLQQYQYKIKQLQIQSPITGQWFTKDSIALNQRYYKRGDIIGYVIDQPATIVRSAVLQQDYDLIQHRLKGIEIRFKNHFNVIYTGTIIRSTPQTQKKLLSPALGSQAGGNITVDPNDQEGMTTLQYYFDLDIQLSQPLDSSVFGDVAYVRYDLGYSPLAWQWTRKLRQLFLEQFYV
ncbi:site-2 protease family protein [Acinetobacter haemolyticus]|uniref:site-2 protease family protein n=1 Tax=Acinetobacter haemolyticus TaxID=29430 RepID=UPI000DE89740|nr:site-2 protease family protein [Acinetobacter haemolyticus]WHR57188.1 hypothetical protein PGW89_12240 [Acinetobacter haemolyticus]